LWYTMVKFVNLTSHLYLVLAFRISAVVSPLVMQLHDVNSDNLTLATSNILIRLDLLLVKSSYCKHLYLFPHIAALWRRKGDVLAGVWLRT
jgi:hypothetical protein